MIERHTLTLPHGISLECRSSGERGRPVLLFLHGFPEAAFTLFHFPFPLFPLHFGCIRTAPSSLSVVPFM